ncbi:hypothetical protein [Planotetraspora mira]|uniref:Lipoprotein n=1 Tax=Planotetraspora mira TaxID=58121 RepID=A0A8J3TQ39_9ACTN|nr:hypothetical protein [Planotetraspora mira]GII29971.1 hypothetical protein Pmi06nite_34130 [Planotetraspora mira]
MHTRLIAVLASSAVLTASLTACGGPSPADTCAEAFTILKDAKIDPQQWALNRGAPVSAAEGKQKAEALARVAALQTDDKDLQTSFAHIKSGSQTYQDELDKLAADPSREPNVQLAGAAVGFFMVSLSQRCDQKGFKP